MAREDGSVIIKATVDVAQAEKDLAKLKGNIAKTEKEIEQLGAKKAPLVEQLGQLGLQADEAARKLYEMQNAAKGTYSSDQIKSQSETARQLGEQFGNVAQQIAGYDRKIQSATEKLERQTEEAGDLAKKINSVSKFSQKMEEAQRKAADNAKRFGNRLKAVVRSALVFTVITKALSEIREWLAGIIQANNEARDAIGRLKGALLTLVQPLINEVLPPFIRLVDLLAAVVYKLAQITAPLFGTTAEDAAKYAEALYEEQKAISGVGESAKKAKKELASFDDINKLSSGEKNTSEISPDFSVAESGGWLDEALSGISEKMTAALLLGGIALVAIGAGLGSIGLVVRGLGLLGIGILVGEQNGAIQKWSKTLGIENVSAFVGTALLLGGIALVAIGAGLANAAMVVSGLGLLGYTVLYSAENERLASWVTSLGLESVNQFISTAVLLGGIALVAIGAIFGNIGMVLAGLGLVGTSVAYADESTKQSWSDALGLDSVFDHITAAIQLAGIALIVFGARFGSLALVIAGGSVLGLGIAADSIGQENLKEWWEVLQLTRVQQWVSVALLLVGIALISIGACMGNIAMILAGALSLGVGTITAASEGNLKDWVTTLGLEKVAGWVTAALLLVGIALIVFGIFTANIMMVIAGAGMLGAGISIGITSGTFSNWTDAILKTLTNFKEKALDAINAVLDGILNLFDAEKKASKYDWYIPNDYSWEFDTAATVSSVPALASGSVVPPNREFLALLGDNKTETEVVSPLSTMKRAMMEALRESGGAGGNFTVTVKGAPGLTRYLKFEIEAESNRQGGSLVGGV